jgi:hypothetical protein
VVVVPLVCVTCITQHRIESHCTTLHHTTSNRTASQEESEKWFDARHDDDVGDDGGSGSGSGSGDRHSFNASSMVAWALGLSPEIFDTRTDSYTGLSPTERERARVLATSDHGTETDSCSVYGIAEQVQRLQQAQERAWAWQQQQQQRRTGDSDSGGDTDDGDGDGDDDAYDYDEDRRQLEWELIQQEVERQLTGLMCSLMCGLLSGCLVVWLSGCLGF